LPVYLNSVLKKQNKNFQKKSAELPLVTQVQGKWERRKTEKSAKTKHLTKDRKE
jgi:hypothetical protein